MGTRGKGGGRGGSRQESELKWPLGVPHGEFGGGLGPEHPGVSGSVDTNVTPSCRRTSLTVAPWQVGVQVSKL